jgi:predicted CXXCH cytochrome family protein
MTDLLQHLRRWSTLTLITILAFAGLVFSQSLPALLDKPTATKPAAADNDCTRSGCHVSLVKRRILHGPVSANKCLECHKYADASQHRFQSLAAPNQGCASCHTPKPKPVAHAPVRDGKCTDCHDPHGSDYTFMLKADPAKDLCQACHKMEKLAGKQFTHDPYAKGKCSACHEAHYAAQPRLLKQAPVAVCVSCHKDTLPRPGEALSIHAPARDDCIACHDPHASSIKNDLKQSTPDSCFSCHKNLKESMASMPVKHFPKPQDGMCDGCHVPHYSRQSKLQKQPQPQECLNCHDKDIRAADGHTITNMAKLLQENPEQHGPIRLGACTACHQPHGSKQKNLLIADYPLDFYAPFKEDLYTLCFTCHSSDIVLKKENAPTGFADGAKNLHALHVNQEKGRTCRACHEVHASREPFHIRESVPFGPSGWPLEIKFQKSTNGGGCSPGCHVPRSYDHGNRPPSVPVIALTPKAQALISSTQPATAPATLTAGGVGAVGALAKGNFPVPPPPFTPGIFPCTTCHDPTLAVNTEKRELHKPHENIQLKHDEEHRWCLDCHNAQNRDVLRRASGEPIPFSESYKLCGQCHGLQYRDWQNGVHGKRTGEWDGTKQYLLCVNCHDPHSPKYKPLTPLPPPVRPGPSK